MENDDAADWVHDFESIGVAVAASERIREGNALAQVERAPHFEADLRPVRYLATLIGVNDGAVPRCFTLAVAPSLDPAAVLLLLALAQRED